MRRPAALLALLLFLWPGAADARKPGKRGRPFDLPPALSVMDFGRVTPGEGEAAAAAEVVLGEEGPVEVFVSVPPAEETAPPLPLQGALALRAGNGPFTAVRPGTDLVLGRAEAPGGILRLEGRLSFPWETPPGGFRLVLRLRLGSAAEVPLTLRGEVAEVLLLEGVPGRWTPRKDFDPSREFSVDFGPQALRVKANVPWRLEARLAEDRGAEARTLFRQASLVFLGERGKTGALAPGRPLTLVQGGPTPSAGVSVSLVPVLVFSGLPEEGSLELPLEVSLVREGSP